MAITLAEAKVGMADKVDQTNFAAVLCCLTDWCLITPSLRALVVPP